MATYKLPPGVFIIRPNQETGVVDFSDPDGKLVDGTPPTPDPPTLNEPIPPVTALNGTAVQVNLFEYFSSTEPMTFSSTTFPRNGLSLSSAGVLSGTATVTETYTGDITATNSGGSITAYFEVSINDPVVIESGRYWNGPNARCVAASSSIAKVCYWDPLDPNNPDNASGTQLLWHQIAAGGFHPNPDWTDSDQRENIKRKLQWLVDSKRPNAIFVPHHNYTTHEFYPRFNSLDMNRDWCLANSTNFAEAYVRDDSGDECSMNTPASRPTPGMYISLSDDACTGIVNNVVGKLYNSDHDLWEIWPAVFSDNMTVGTRRQGGAPLSEGTISSLSGTTYTAPTYSFPASHLGSADPGDGTYTLLTKTYSALFTPSTLNGSSAEGTRLYSVKDLGGGNMSYKFNTAFKGNTVANGWTARLFFAEPTDSTLQWPSAESNGASFVQTTNTLTTTTAGADPANEPWQRGSAHLRVFKAQDDYIENKIGVRYGPMFNSVSGTHLNKWADGLAINFPKSQSASMVHCEGVSKGLSGTKSDRTFRWTNNTSLIKYDFRKDIELEYLISKFPLGTAHLDRTGTFDFPKPYIIGSYTLGDNPVDGLVDDVSQKGCAYMSFWETLVIMAGGGDWLANGLNSKAYRFQFNTGAFIVSLGDAPVTPATAFDVTPVEDNTDDWLTDPTDPYAQRWGLHSSYDPAGNRTNGPPLSGSTTIRDSDWGGAPYQWEMWFPEGNDTGRIIVLLINSRKVGTTISDWIPHDESGGQTIDSSLDTYTVHDIPTGKRIYTLDLTDYVNPEDGTSLYTGKMAQVKGKNTDVRFQTVKYPNVANGRPGIGNLVGGTGQNGATLTLGPGEAQWLIIDDVA